jgi:hypothetical protein
MSKVDKHAQICKSLNELYARKNADYGDSFGKSFTEYGLTMACIRLEDKLNRIKALRAREAQVADESITDTLMDLANYSIMTLIEMDRSKPIEAPEPDHHDIQCALMHPTCQCVTCMRDHEDCCEEGEHLHHTCQMSDCPDYVKEEKDS